MCCSIVKAVRLIKKDTLNFITGIRAKRSFHSIAVVLSAILGLKLNTSALMCYTLFICVSYGEIAFGL